METTAQTRIAFLREAIDAKIKLLKGLRSFNWIHVEKTDVEISEKEFGICMTRGEASLGLVGGPYRFHSIVRTDRGAFRFGSSYRKFDSVDFIFDLKSKEVNKSIDCLLMARAWLGIALGDLGEETPYKNDGKRKVRDDIELPTDVAKKTQGFMGVMHGDGDAIRLGSDYLTSDNWFEKNHIEKVDILREMIAVCKKSGERIYGVLACNIQPLTANAIRTNLCEARMWLGMELQRAKNDPKLK